MGYGSGIAMSCGAGHRRGLDLALLWLWRRPVATAPIGPLAWEPPYASGVALKRFFFPLGNGEGERRERRQGYESVI